MPHYQPITISIAILITISISITNTSTVGLLPTTLRPQLQRRFQSLLGIVCDVVLTVSQLDDVPMDRIHRESKSIAIPLAMMMVGHRQRPTSMSSFSPQCL